MQASTIYLTDPHLGKVLLPGLAKSYSHRALPTRKARDGEVGIFIAKQWRKVDGVWRLIWHSVTHNERVDAGAAIQAVQLFGGSGTPAAPSATNYPGVAVAVASATLTKAKTNQSLGSDSSGVTTNEYTTIGLSRAAAAAQIGGNYTAPSSLGGTFAQITSKVFTASGGGTAYGAGLFDRTATASSILYVEDNFGSTAVLVSGDTLTVNITNTN